MEILLWLVPPVVVTVLTAMWVSWAERRGDGAASGRAGPGRSDAAYERFAAAVQRPLTEGRRRPRAVRTAVRAPDRSTGVAVRPSRRDGLESPRRSA